MNDILVNIPHKIHLIGIGGVSMSGIAEMLADMGKKVSGSDRQSSSLTEKLENMGIKICIGHSAENVEGCDLVVYSAAIHEDNPERMRAKELNIPQVERAEMLGRLMKEYTSPICISGTHGKTTTTGMISQEFIDCGKNPTVTVGGSLDLIGGNMKVAGKDYFIAESCEYHRSFLSFFPKAAVILNIEEDHLDYYKDLDDILSAFRDFCALVPNDGCIIANYDEENVIKAVEGAKCKVLSFAIDSDAEYTAKNLVSDENGFYSYDLYIKGENRGRISLSVPGIYNVSNSLAAIAAADFFGLDLQDAGAALKRYEGTHRRFEKKGEYNGAVIVDDYAHHPTEINATLSAASVMDYDNIYLVFQPHTYSRTYTLYNDFKRVLSAEGIQVILADIYAAREVDTGLVSSRQLAEDIGAKYLPSFGEIEEYLKNVAAPRTLIITMGAGDVYKIGENLLKN